MAKRKILLLIKIFLVFILIFLSSCSKYNQITQTPTQAVQTPFSTPFRSTLTPEPGASVTSIPKVSPSQVSASPVLTSTVVSPTPTQVKQPVLTGKIAFTTLIDSPGIDVIDPNGSHQSTLINKAPPNYKNERPYFYSVPSWSPDGQWIAFASDFASPGTAIYKIKTDGSGLQRLKAGQDPAWSPDGLKIAFSLDDNIATIQADGSNLKQLTHSQGVEAAPAWSPNGEKIAYLSQRKEPLNSADLYLMNSDGSEPKIVIDIAALWSKISWSPDGNTIAFIGYENKDHSCRLFTVQPDGQALTAVTSAEWHVREPSWSADGKWLVVNASYGVNATPCNSVVGWELYIINIETQQMFEILTTAGDYTGQPAWSPVPSLGVNDSYRVTNLAGYCSLYGEPSQLVKSLKIFKAGDSFTVLSGPIEKEGWYWWKIKTDESLEGWIVDAAGWYQKK